MLTYNSGFGGAAGVGGAGGAAGTLPASGPIIGFETTNNQVLFSQLVAGNAGTSGFAGNGGDGAGAYSYQLDNHPDEPRETVPLTNPSGTSNTGNQLSVDAAKKSFNGYQGVVSAGGGAGYGGGGSGAVRALSSILTGEKWNGNSASTGGVRQDVGALLQAGSGGAGGSYIAPAVSGGTIASSNNGAKESGVRNPGYVKITLCERV